MDNLYDSGRGGERKRTIVWNDPQINKREAVSSVSGLDYLRSIRDGKISPPPAAQLIGYQIREVDHGFASFELQPGEYHYNPFATVHGGILSTLLDTTMTIKSIIKMVEIIPRKILKLFATFVMIKSTETTSNIMIQRRPEILGRRCNLKIRLGRAFLAGTVWSSTRRSFVPYEIFTT